MKIRSGSARAEPLFFYGMGVLFEDMDLKHKHWALISVGMLVAILAAIAAWYMLGSEKVIAPTSPTATSTGQTASTTAAAAPAAHIIEHAAYYDIDLAYPSATPLASLSADANAKAVATMKAAMQGTADQFVKDGNFANLTQKDIQMMGLTQRKESLGAQYKGYTSKHTISYVFAIYSDTLGAHPNTVYQVFTFDTQTGAQLGLGDLFTVSTYLNELSTIANQQLPSILADREQVNVSEVDTDYMAQGSAPKAENYQDWYLNGNNLVIVFPPYQVGPYALGTIEMPISLSQLSLLKVGYR